jgi:hypothetical protein
MIIFIENVRGALEIGARKTKCLPRNAIDWYNSGAQLLPY